jgi:putative membrane protein
MHLLAHGPFGYRWENDYWWVASFVWFLLIGGLVALAVLLALRLTGRSPTAATAAGPPRSALDPAVNELRLRYARGEISRDEYLRTAADLGAPLPPPDAPPPPPAA